MVPLYGLSLFIATVAASGFVCGLVCHWWFLSWVGVLLLLWVLMFAGLVVFLIG